MEINSIQNSKTFSNLRNVGFNGSLVYSRDVDNRSWHKIDARNILSMDIHPEKKTEQSLVTLPKNNLFQMKWV